MVYAEAGHGAGRGRAGDSLMQQETQDGFMQSAEVMTRVGVDVDGDLLGGPFGEHDRTLSHFGLCCDKVHSYAATNRLRIRAGGCRAEHSPTRCRKMVAEGCHLRGVSAQLRR